MPVGHADGLVALQARRGGLVDDGVDVADAAQQAHALGDFAGKARFDASVTLFAEFTKGVARDAGAGAGQLKERDSGQHVVVQVVLDAEFFLLGLEGRQRFAWIGDGRAGRRGVALRQAFDVAGVDRQIRPHLEDDAGQRRGGALVIARTAGLTVGEVVVLALHVLAARAQRQLQPVVHETQGVGQRVAGQLGALVAVKRIADAGDGRRVEDVAGVDIGIARRETGVETQIGLLVQQRVAEGDLVAHGAGLEVAAQAGFGGLAVHRHPLPAAEEGVIALRVLQHGVGGEGVPVQLALAVACVGSQVVGDVVFDLEHAGGIAAVAPAQARIRILVARRLGNRGQVRTKLKLAHDVVDAFLLPDQVQGGPQLFTPIVQRNRPQRFACRLVLDWRVAVAQHPVHADAKRVVGTEAASHVGMHAKDGVRHDRARDPGDGLIGGAFGHQIDDTPHAAARRHAEERRRRSLDDLHAFQGLDRCAPIGRQAEHAVEREVCGRHIEAADGEVFVDVGTGTAHAHGRIHGGHVGDRPGLLVLDRLGGIAGDAERGVHDGRVAQDAHAGAAADQTAGDGRGRLAQGDRRAGHRDGGQDGDRGRRLRLRRYRGGIKRGAARQRLFHRPGDALPPALTAIRCFTHSPTPCVLLYKTRMIIILSTYRHAGLSGCGADASMSRNPDLIRHRQSLDVHTKSCPYQSAGHRQIMAA